MSERKLFISFIATKKFDECDYYFKIAIRRAIEATLEYEDFPSDAEVSVTFTDNEYIKKLNGQYRNKDAATDVLSFPLYDFECEDDMPEGESLPLGDIVISIARAKEQAKEIGHSFIEECAFLAVHSTLHLLGYDHERSPEDEAAQIAAQKKIFEGFTI